MMNILKYRGIAGYQDRGKCDTILTGSHATVGSEDILKYRGIAGYQDGGECGTRVTGSHATVGSDEHPEI